MLTLVSRNPSSLLSALSHTHLPESPSKALLFALAPSSTVTPRELSALTNRLTKRFPTHVGCISAPVPISNNPQCSDHCSVSLALVDGIPFHSTIPGRPEPQVGRWHAGRNRIVSEDDTQMNKVAGSTGHDILHTILGKNGEVDWKKLWSLPSSSDGGVGYELPHDLRYLEPSTINSIIYFSDRASEGISTALQNAFPSSNKLALLASSTPFLTGRPVTLFHNGQIHSNGAVGIALPTSSPSHLALSFPTLAPLTPALPITSAEGNLILSINSNNPTRLLLSAIQKRGLSLSGNSTSVGKEDSFYVGMIEGGKVSQLYHINSGDPSRGTIALDTNMAPREGSLVQLYHLPQQSFTSVAVDTSSDRFQKPSISLMVSPEIDFLTSSMYDRHSDHGTPAFPYKTVLNNTFIAASENGVILSEGNSSMNVPWTCTVPGGRITLTWD